MKHDKIFVMCPRNNTQQRGSLPTLVCRERFAVCYTRGKGFTVWISAFAVCLWHTASHAIPVVHVTLALAILCADAGGDAVLLSTI